MRKVVIESKYFLNILFYDSYSFLRRSSNLVTIFNFTKKKKKRSQRYTILTLKLNQTQFKISIRAHKKNQFTLSIPTWFPPRAACYFLQFIAHFLSKFPSLATFIQIPLTGHYLPAACLLLFAVDDKSSLEQVVDVFMKFWFWFLSKIRLFVLSME